MDFLYEISKLFGVCSRFVLQNIDPIIRIAFVLAAFVVIKALIKRLEHQKNSRW